MTPRSMDNTASRVSEERLAEMQKDCGIPNLPTQETYWFRKALAGEGPHAYDWSDKPHRLVFDLCRLIEADAALRSKPKAGVVTDDMVERFDEAFYGRHERGFIMRPLISDENGRRDTRAALTAALNGDKP